jgi:hypothetical protein
MKNTLENQDWEDPVIAPQLFLIAYRTAPKPRLKLITNVMILIIGMIKRIQSTRNPRV